MVAYLETVPFCLAEDERICIANIDYGIRVFDLWSYESVV